MSGRKAAALNSRYCNYGDGDSLRYINRRKQVERWLLQRARAVGIRPEDDIPLHFLIISEKLPDPRIRGGAVLSLRAQCLPIHLVSFTFDDGLYNYAREVERATLRIQHELHGQVLESRRLATALESTDGFLHVCLMGAIRDILRHTCGPGGYQISPGRTRKHESLASLSVLGLAVTNGAP